MIENRLPFWTRGDRPSDYDRRLTSRVCPSATEDTEEETTDGR